MGEETSGNLLPVAVHVFMLRKQAVFLLRYVDTAFDDGNYGLVSADLKGNESIIQAAIRACRDDVGVELTPDDLELASVVHYNAPDREGIDFFLCARNWLGEPTNLKPDEYADVLWAPVDSLPDGVIKYVRRALENLRAGVWFDEIG
jgi:ADP-ribose pyrophosphatase YjhB (NUDIX family)